MSNKIVICYDLYEADNTLRDKVVKILKENTIKRLTEIIVQNLILLVCIRITSQFL